MKKYHIAAIGNIYVETNYLGLVTGGSDTIQSGKEYRAQEYEVRLGGSAANFSIQIRRFGGNAAIIGKAGNDDNGKKLLSLFANAGIDTDLIRQSQDSDIQTCIDTGLVLAHNGQNIQVVAGNANQTLNINDIDIGNPYFNQVNLVYLGGFMKQEALYRDYPRILSKFKDKGIKIFLDHGRVPVDFTENKRSVLLEVLHFVDGYLPNREELLDVSGLSDISAALNWVLELGVKMVAVKLGENGCRIKDSLTDISIPGYHIKAVNSVGAGDVFNAGFIHEYLSGKGLKYCIQFANAAAAIKVSRNIHPDVSTVLKFMNLQENSTYQS
jgi:ribokinase